MVQDDGLVWLFLEVLVLLSFVLIVVAGIVYSIIWCVCKAIEAFMRDKNPTNVEYEHENFIRSSSVPNVPPPLRGSFQNLMIHVITCDNSASDQRSISELISYVIYFN